MGQLATTMHHKPTRFRALGRLADINVSVPVPVSTKSATLLADDQKANPDRQDDQANRPENNADLGKIAREQQHATKRSHGVPTLQRS